ncbi:MAG TPA: GAF domain-containing sensor histidine kinase [Longimicrobium sp.]|nr:GAF domain-containing sensor histidine kinase [Longimicrobium sp.]
MPLLLPPPDRRSEQLRKLTEISRALTYTVSTGEVLRLAAARAADLLEADRAIVMTADERGLLRVRAWHGVDEAALRRFGEALDDPLVERLQGLLGAPLGEGYLGVPLVAQGVVTGALAVARRQGPPCTDEDEWILSAAADQVAVALEIARLEEEVRREREERTRAAEGASVADEATDRALATLSHDLRSPLNAIDSYAELMEMAILGPVSERQLEALGRIRMSGRHLLAVLQNVLEMTRLSAGGVRIDATPVPVGGVVEEAVQMVRPSAAAKSQSLAVAAPPSITLRADPDRLRQVLVNLIGNAVKYTPPSGSIRIGASLAEAEGRRWGMIEVADTGPGIPAEKLQVIFQPYYRLPGAEADAPEGLGLGLAISRELIRQMGGDIEVHSALGQGSRFTIRLPLADEGADGG